MKKFIAIILAFTFAFLVACSNNEQENVRYINGANPSGLDREIASSWDDFVTPTADPSSADVQNQMSASEILPENFPGVPDGASDIRLAVMPYSEDSGYPGEYIELKLIGDFTCMVLFSQSLKDIGYKGGVKEIRDGTYYPSGIHGAWQDGTNLIRIVGTEPIADGTTDITLHIVKCENLFPEELAAFIAPFSGFSGTIPYYYEIEESGSTLRDFNGGFHAKWIMNFSDDASFVGVMRSDFENYLVTLEESGYTIGSTEAGTLDGCNTFLVDAMSSDESIYIIMIYNESIASLDYYVTNDIEGFEEWLYGE